MRRLVVMVLSVALLWRVTPAPAELAAVKILTSDPNVTVSYYNIGGNDTEQIRSELNAKGPLDVLGKRRYALTKWLIKWRWPTAPSGAPAIDQTEGSYSAEITLPRWSGREEASPELRDKWDRFFEALVKHEQQHVLTAAKNYNVPAIKIKDKHKESELSVEGANQIGHKTIANLRLLDLKYDRETDHGKSEGIVW